jgi:hypothetical protein
MNPISATTASNIDRVNIPGTGKMAGKNLAVTVSCELMRNQLPAVPIEPTTDIAVVQDSAGRPMIFTIGSDQKFRLLKPDSGSTTGWSVVDLMAGFTGYSGVAAFDVVEDIKGYITVVVALTRNGTEATDLFIAPMLSNDFAKTDWASFLKLTIPISGIDAAFIAKKIRMGTSDDGQAPFVTIVGILGPQQIYYQLTSPGAPATKLEFPENVPTDSNALMDLAVGFAFGQRGVWYLYSVGQTETLECTTLATADQGSLTFDFSPGYKAIPATIRYNCIATPTGSQTDPFSISSDVYVGTDGGIFLFRGARAEAMQTVTDQIKDVHQIIVKQDQASIAVWAVCSPNQLYYIYGKKGATYTWNAPILFSQSVVHLAPLRVRTRQTNEVFVVNQDLSVTHHWQDPQSTLWQQRVIKTPKSDYLFDVTTFTTVLHLEDDVGNALVGTTLEITASEWTYVTANGLVYSLDHDTPAKIATDASGAVTVIALTADIASPILHVQSAAFDKTLNVYPNGKIKQGLQAIKTGDDLKNARTASGPVVDPSIHQDTLDGVAYNVGQLTSASSQYTTGSQPTGTTFVTVEDDTKHTGTLSVAQLPQNFALGMKLEGGVWQVHPTPQAATIAPRGVIDEIVTFAGDALHWLETAFTDGIKLIEQGVTYLNDGVSFVIKKVEDALVFVLNIADKVFNIALKTLGAVFKALNWILKLVGIDLTKILAWLGHLFGWDEIWKTHKVIAALMTSGLNYAVERVQADIEHWRASADKLAEQFAQQIKNLVISPQLQKTSPKGTAQTDTQQHPEANFNTPPSNWLFYHMQHGGLLEGPLTAHAGNDPFSQFINDIVVPTVSTIATDFEKDLTDLERIFTDSTVTIQDVATLFSDLVDTIIDPIKTVVTGLLQFFADLLGDLKNLLEDPLNIPLLSTFYSWVTELLGEEEDLSAINAVALLLAIPYTYLYEAIKGHAPFADGSYGLDDPQLYHKLLGTPARQAPVRAAFSEQMLIATSAVTSDDATTPEQMLIATPALTSDDATTRALSLYSRIGGGIAAVASVAASIAGFVATGQGIQQGKLNVAQKVQLALQALKCLGSIPMPHTGQNDAAYGLKCTAYVIGAINVGTNWKISSPTAKGGVLIGFDAVILVLSLIADGLGNVDWWTWVTDIFSNLGGCIQGIGQVSEQGEITVTGAGVSYLGGSLIGFIHALLANETDIIHLVNVGG